jgi:methyl-accepting chemotaxis protein
MIMASRWTFGQKVGAGFAATTFLTVVIGALAMISVRNVATSKDHVINNTAHQLVNAERLRAGADEKVASFRAFLLTGQEAHIAAAQTARSEFGTVLQQLRANSDPAEVSLLDAVEQAEGQHQAASERIVAQRRTGAPLEQVGATFEAQAAPLREALGQAIANLRDFLNRKLATDRDAASASATQAIVVTVIIALIALVLAVLLAVVLTRGLKRQIGGVVGHVQSSSAELEAAAGQQANGAREQAVAMGEVTTTMNELLITSRQIVESAQRVSRIAEETAEAARTGGATIEETQASITAIRRQVDLIVGHMLELGEKSQQIGGIADVVSELAEQTNILAINATIEASGAGEWGRRFAVVADEIRRLADRTTGSAKEIRALIEDVRGAVNTTVMATETGAKAVDAGSRRFDELTEAFGRISHLVSATTEAAREIELSTKQQTTAIEQANIAVGDTARVTRETETSANQIGQTASHLAGLSTDLKRLVVATSGR